jgi:putative glutamate/gamma-aminobutyrate antiporter
MSKKVISIFTLVMINLAAIGSIRNWPTIAETGFSSVFFFLLAALVFFLPTALISAELATGWPKIGGIFVWVKEAFGQRLGFLAIWLLWVENVVWYPTILTFIAATIAYIFDPSWGENKTYLILTSLASFWLLTWINMKGMKISGYISTVGVIIGSFIPAAVIIFLGCSWYFAGRPLQIDLNWDSFIPNMSSPKQWVVFTGVLFSLCGMEMSAIHARDVQNPQRNYPRAMFYTVLIVIIPSILGVLAVSSVVPQHEISLTAGTMQAFVSFVDSYNLHALIPVMAVLVFAGAVASLSTWIVGPSRGLLAAAQNGDLPPKFRQLNKHGMPGNLLMTQGWIVTALSLLFVLMPSINSAYWILTVLVAHVYLIMYMIMFAAAIKLRYSHPHVPRAYKIPGGKCGMWIVASLGIVSAFCTLIIGFFPPAQIPTGNVTFYVLFLIVGIALICLAPSVILKFKKPSWEKRLSHETGDDE